MVDALFNQPCHTLCQLKFVHVLLPNALIAVHVPGQPSRCKFSMPLLAIQQTQQIGLPGQLVGCLAYEGASNNLAVSSETGVWLCHCVASQG